jgi:hypothetical protein
LLLLATFAFCVLAGASLLVCALSRAVSRVLIVEATLAAKVDFAALAACWARLSRWARRWRSGALYGGGGGEGGGAGGL